MPPDHSFDQRYWESHYSANPNHGHTSVEDHPVNPHLATELQGLSPGTALDAGCGSGSEALWLASHGWLTTGVDLAASAIELAMERTGRLALADPVSAARIVWEVQDLTTWEPITPFDLVMTNFAHSTLSQIELYQRLASWVAPGGTLLITAHPPLDSGKAGLDHSPHPHEATASAHAIVSGLDGAEWTVQTAELRQAHDGDPGLDPQRTDVVVRLMRTS